MFMTRSEDVSFVFHSTRHSHIQRYKFALKSCDIQKGIFWFNGKDCVNSFEIVPKKQIPFVFLSILNDRPYSIYNFLINAFIIEAQIKRDDFTTHLFIIIRFCNFRYNNQKSIIILKPLSCNFLNLLHDKKDFLNYIIRRHIICDAYIK